MSDDFERGFHDVIDDEKLRAMTDVQLDSALESSKDKPVRAKAIQREIDRRAKPWYERPRGIFALTVISGVAVAAVCAYFGWN